jgi:hypothetical protein
MKFTLGATLVFITSALATCSYSDTSDFRILLCTDTDCDGSSFEMEQANSTSCTCTQVPSFWVGNVASIVTQATNKTGEVRLFLDADCSSGPYGKYCPFTARLWLNFGVRNALWRMDGFGRDKPIEVPSGLWLLSCRSGHCITPMMHYRFRVTRRFRKCVELESKIHAYTLLCLCTITPDVFCE